jgi:hypothetical protein
MRTAIAICVLLSAGLLAACDYPQAGFYNLVARDDRGAVVAQFPFAVEELTDDTAMTTGYRVLLPAAPAGGKPRAVEVPVANGTDLTRRDWLCAVADADSHAGDLHIDLAHAGERLAFVGAYRPDAFAAVSRIAAVIFSSAAAASTRVEFVGALPGVPRAKGAVQWELDTLSREAFEKALGGALAQAQREPAAAVAPAFLDAARVAESVPLEQAELAPTQPKPAPAKAQAKPKPGGKNKQPPTLGGRSGRRPR